MWVSTYIPSSLLAKPSSTESAACIPGHYGNSRASGNHESCPPLRKVAEAQGERRRWFGSKTPPLTYIHREMTASCLPALRLAFNSQKLTFKEWVKRKVFVCRAPESGGGAFHMRLMFTKTYIRHIFWIINQRLFALRSPVLLSVAVMNVHQTWFNSERERRKAN